MSNEADLRLTEHSDDVWSLAGVDASRFVLVDEFLTHLVDRNYSPKTVRAYGYDLLGFCRWLHVEDVDVADVDVEVLLRYLRACREAKVPGRPGPNVVAMSGRRLDQYAPATINRRLAAISALYAFAVMRNPAVKNPVPKGKEARWLTTGERNGLLAHTRRRAKDRSSLRLREPRRLPTALSQP
ncbi:MAG: site-specific integrase, partial [Pseudonocardiaceae bacterium]